MADHYKHVNRFFVFTQIRLHFLRQICSFLGGGGVIYVDPFCICVQKLHMTVVYSIKFFLLKIYGPQTTREGGRCVISLHTVADDKT